MLNKKGTFTVTQIMSLLLGIAVAALLILLLVNILAPTFNKGEKSSEGYFASFMEQIGVAKRGEVGEFSLWQPKEALGAEARRYFLVYFGDKYKFTAGGFELTSLAINTNRVCVCYTYKAEGYCDACKNLDFPMSMGGSYLPWAVAEREPIKIELKNKNGTNEYVVTKV